MPRPYRTTVQRGYGVTHRAIRAAWKPTVDAGVVNCYRCGKPIPPGTPWDLGHTEDRTGWTGPEHVTCNRRAGANKANAARRQPRSVRIGAIRRRTSREW